MLSSPRVQLTETFRPQVPYLKETVLDLKAHRRKEGYERLDAHGDIIEIEARPARLRHTRPGAKRRLLSI